jgi:hypothetical protein
MTSLRSLALFGVLLATSLLPKETLAEEQNAYIVSHEEPAAQRVMKMNLSFTAEFKQRVVNDNGPEGPTVDDGLGGNGVLRNLSGKQIGRFDTNQRVTEHGEAGEMRMVLAEYVFGDGRDSILLSGAELFQKSFGVVAPQRDLVYGVSAGTGKFMAARGECHVRRSDKGEYTVNCVLFVPEF